MSCEEYNDMDYDDAHQVTFESLMNEQSNELNDRADSSNVVKCEDGNEDSFSPSAGFNSLPYLNDSNIPVCICRTMGKVIYRNSAAKKYLPELRRGSFIRKYVSDLSFSSYNSLCDHPGSAECIYIDGAGSVFRNSVTTSVEYNGEFYTVWMFFRVLQFPGIIGSNTALPEYLCRSAKRIVSDKREIFFSDKDSYGHVKHIRFSSGEIYDGFFDQYIPGLAVPVPAYHIVDTVSRLFRKYTRELGMRIDVRNNITGDRFKLIDDYVAFADSCLRIFTLFSEISQNRSINVSFFDGEDSICMRITFCPADSDTVVADGKMISECFGNSSVRFALDILCVEQITESLGWTISIKQITRTIECDVSIPVSHGDSFGILRSYETEQKNMAFVMSELGRYIAFIAENFAHDSRTEERG